MIFGKNRTLIVKDRKISIKILDGEEFLSLTDMVKGENGSDHIKNWMRNRNTVEFLGLWETISNVDFKGVEFDRFRKEAGLNNFTLSPQKWIKETNAKGIISKSGRYGGTYAHKDIAFEFGTWISSAFKLYLIKEYQRLKEIENNQYNLDWNVKRMLSKVNYQVHTDAVKEFILPVSTKWKKEMEYAEEADLLNLAIMGKASKDIRNELKLGKKQNIRDYFSIIDLTLISNAESYNSTMIKEGLSKQERFEKIKEMADTQRSSLEKNDKIKSLDKKTLDLLIETESKKS